MQHKLGGNSRFDRKGNKYQITLTVYGRRETIEYPDRYTFLEALKYYRREVNQFICSYSNVDSTNVDNLNIIEG